MDYFKNFQNEMNQRERIPTSLVESYKDKTHFLASMNKYIVCLVQPRALWMTPFRYEAKDEEATPYIEKLLA